MVCRCVREGWKRIARNEMELAEWSEDYERTARP